MAGIIADGARIVHSAAFVSNRVDASGDAAEFGQGDEETARMVTGSGRSQARIRV
ncbi:MAG: hypothetical protein N2383_13150 [Caldilineales bacterium]|nr:hypothetical protein [Caldilineales bacterium]